MNVSAKDGSNEITTERGTLQYFDLYHREESRINFWRKTVSKKIFCDDRNQINVSQICKNTSMYKHFSLHNLLEFDIWCSQREGFVKHAELGQVLEIFTIHIRVLLNSADEWKMSVMVCTWMVAHYPSISSRNYSSVAGFVGYTASFKYLHKGKSSGINSGERGGTHPFSYYPSDWKNLINVAPVTSVVMWDAPSC